MRIRGFVASLILLSCTSCAQFAAKGIADVRGLDRFVDQVAATSPGYAVIVVDENGTLLMKTGGVLDAETNSPVTPDSPFYIASMTKAYVGLLAAELHAEGVLDLDSTVTDYWPDLVTKTGVDFSTITLRDLLTHQAPFKAELIAVMEAYVTSIPGSEYPRYLSMLAIPRDPGFEYANIGYNVYTGILEDVTGRSWQDWLQEKVFHPLKLSRTSARTSDFELDEMAWRHQWKGNSDWHVLPPKTDPLMQSAGGMMTSPNDMARWLSVNLRQRNNGAFRTAQTSYVDVPVDAGDEMACDGYALGWKVCSFHGQRVLQHGGGYTGVRTRMALMPDKGIGVAVLTNSDNMTGFITTRFLEFYLAAMAGFPWPDARVDEVLKTHSERIGNLLAGRRQRARENRAEARWSGWSWKPSGDELAAYAGTYANDVFGTLDIRVDGGRLHWKIDGWEMPLSPAKRDRFGGASSPYEELEQVDFERDDTGAIRGVRWNNYFFQAVNPN